LRGRTRLRRRLSGGGGRWRGRLIRNGGKRDWRTHIGGLQMGRTSSLIMKQMKGAVFLRGKNYVMVRVRVIQLT
jgi:hypothetical protein